MPATRSEPSSGRGQRGDGADERRLAGAVGAEHGGDRARRGDEVEAVEGGDVAEALAQAEGLDGRGAGVGEVFMRPSCATEVVTC